MVKKSKPSGKVESTASVKEETIAVKEETTASVKEEAIASGKDGEGINFFYVFAGGGALLAIIFIMFIILRYVLHMV